MPKLEVCCYSAECAIIAEQSGADRIELCCGPKEGGLTPGYGTLCSVRERTTLPVHPIVRPRSGDFCYSTIEFEVMLSELKQIRDMGFPGVVIGLLDVEGSVDLTRMRRVMSHAGNMAITFHRAFDMCRNPYHTLSQLTDLGVARILSSGQQQSAEIGLGLLKELTTLSRGPIIIAAGGIRLTNLNKFVKGGIKEVHSSAGKFVASAIRYRKAGININTDIEVDECSHYCVNSEMVAQMKHALSVPPLTPPLI